MSSCESNCDPFFTEKKDMHEKKEQWNFRPRLYPHVDRLVSKKKRKVEGFVTNPEKVSKHSFLPFIEDSQSFRRFPKDQMEQDPKERPIKYASHKDAQVFSYYRTILNRKYEEKLQELGLSENVIAYRKIPVDKDANRGKCNIHFAKEAFDEVSKRESSVALTFDISNFFESLDHSILEECWREIMDFKEMPPDHKSVFKNITSYRSMKKEKVYEALGLLGIENGKIVYRSPPFKIGKKKKTLCSMKEYRNLIVAKKLVKKNIDSKGVPQGSPMSDVLANMYMLKFDLEMRELEKKYGAYYRRYSDDILFICPPECSEKIKRELKSSLKSHSQNTLALNDSKTTETHFFKKNGKLSYKGDLFSYLGFSFTGTKVFFRDKTISSLKRRSVWAIKKYIRDFKRNCPEESKKKPDISKVFHKTYFLNKKWKKEKKRSGKRMNNFFNYFLRAQKIFNEDKNKSYVFSDNQVRKHKRFIINKCEDMGIKTSTPSPHKT